jgi:RNA polymerase sigma factor (sigma-70 family)
VRTSDPISLGEDPPDAELLIAAQTDPRAFAVFYDRHARDVLAFFYRRTASVSVSADLTAETFAEAFASRTAYRDDGRPGQRWLYGIAKHELGRFIRRRRVEDRAQQRLGMERQSMDDVSIERIEALVDFAPVAEALHEAVGRLPSKLQEAIHLRVAMSLSYRQVAERLRCSEGAARVRVARGLSRLAEFMEDLPGQRKIERGEEEEL